MSEHSFDAFTQRAASPISRRASLLALGALGTTAMLRPITAEGKKNKKKNMSDKKATKECKSELAECTTQAELCSAQAEHAPFLFPPFAPATQHARM